MRSNLRVIFKEAFFGNSINATFRAVTKKPWAIRPSIYMDITFPSIYCRQRVISFFSNGLGLLMGA